MKRPRQDDRIDKSHVMPIDERLAWLLNEITRRKHVNILVADFVDDYTSHTNAPHEIMMYGANRCRLLSSDLLTLYRTNRDTISRQPVGVPEARSYQFPTWVWSYHMRTP